MLDCPRRARLVLPTGGPTTGCLAACSPNAGRRSTVVVVLRIWTTTGTNAPAIGPGRRDGIPPRIREKVFDLFYQKNPDSGKGFGIGLSLVKLLVEKHNGRVYVDRHTVAGCELTVEIPDSGASARGVRAPSRPRTGR